jgi:hypothetical protein
MNTTFDASEVLVACLVSFGVALIIGIAVGTKLGEGDAHRSAVKAGVGRYVSDTDGSSKFEWIVPLEKH